MCQGTYVCHVDTMTLIMLRAGLFLVYLTDFSPINSLTPNWRVKSQSRQGFPPVKP